MAYRVATRSISESPQRGGKVTATSAAWASTADADVNVMVTMRIASNVQVTTYKDGTHAFAKSSCDALTDKMTKEVDDELRV